MAIMQQSLFLYLGASLISSTIVLTRGIARATLVAVYWPLDRRRLGR